MRGVLKGDYGGDYGGGDYGGDYGGRVSHRLWSITNELHVYSKAVKSRVL